MPISVMCSCGTSYDLKDEFAGRALACPKCGATIRVPGTPLEVRRQADPAFDRDRFLLRQKHLAISEKYYVWDEQGGTILYVERPALLARNLAATFVALLAAVAWFWVLGTLADANPPGFVRTTLGVLSVVGFLPVLLAVGVALSAKRHVTFYRDDTKQQALLAVLQDRKFQPITATYTVRGASGEMLAKLRKNYLYNLFRKRWYCDAPDGGPICVAREDSVILSLLRRVLGSFFGLLRTNFVILRPSDDAVAGHFNRKFTLLDRYVLDMTSDPIRTIDRRVALALGVMLDTGERR